MCRIKIVLLLQAAVLLSILSQPIRASDGDVDYSSPYITVDPKTGQLVTRNPGPRLKTHTMDMASEKTADSVAAITADPAAAATAQTPAAATVQDAGAPSGSGISPATIAMIAGGLFVFGIVISRMKKQKP